MAGQSCQLFRVFCKLFQSLFRWQAASNLAGLSFFWSRAGAAEAERRMLRTQVGQLREENLQLHDQLRGYLRCVAPTWWESEPVSRGPPTRRVLEPQLAAPGTTPWRGVRSMGL